MSAVRATSNGSVPRPAIRVAVSFRRASIRSASVVITLTASQAVSPTCWTRSSLPFRKSMMPLAVVGIAIGSPFTGRQQRSFLDPLEEVDQVLGHRPGPLARVAADDPRAESLVKSLVEPAGLLEGIVELRARSWHLLSGRLHQSGIHGCQGRLLGERVDLVVQLLDRLPRGVETLCERLERA